MFKQTTVCKEAFLAFFSLFAHLDLTLLFSSVLSYKHIPQANDTTQVPGAST